MTETLTEKQRVAMEALEGAQRAGMPLSDYAKSNGLELRPVYDAIAALRRRGALPKPERTRKRRAKGDFVAIRVSDTAAVAREIAHVGRDELVCRLVGADGWTIECRQWPRPQWVATLLSGEKDAAA
jgi:hypothetical protein